MTRRAVLALVALVLAAVIAPPAAAQRVAITLPRDSVLVGDTIKNVAATAHDTRNRRVPSAKFAWSTTPATALRVVPNGNGTAAILVGLAATPGASVAVNAVWKRSDGASPKATVVVRVVSRAPVLVPVAGLATGFMRFSVARRLGFCGDTSFNPAAVPPSTDTVIAEYVPKDTVDAWTAHCAAARAARAAMAARTAPRSQVSIPVKKP
jgi:hypothetical protein